MGIHLRGAGSFWKEASDLVAILKKEWCLPVFMDEDELQALFEV
jgi:hypothetical protein